MAKQRKCKPVSSLFESFSQVWGQKRTLRVRGSLALLGRRAGARHLVWLPRSSGRRRPALLLCAATLTHGENVSAGRASQGEPSCARLRSRTGKWKGEPSCAVLRDGTQAAACTTAVRGYARLGITNPVLRQSLFCVREIGGSGGETQLGSLFFARPGCIL